MIENQFGKALALLAFHHKSFEYKQKSLQLYEWFKGKLNTRVRDYRIDKRNYTLTESI